mmetsp:Transcript_101782/g.328459  ORF Transcript_101782/g.328459 Transcript_101782/m.328459 type:complete len:273 (+) Transcript_101782:177-995(+)
MPPWVASVLPTVHELLEGWRCSVAAFTRVKVDAVAIQQRVAGHVEDVHEVKGHEKAHDHRDRHRRDGAAHAGEARVLRGHAMCGRDVGEGARGQRDDSCPEHREDKGRPVKYGHGPPKLDNHLQCLPGSITEVVRGDGNVNVGILVDKLHDVLAAMNATRATAEDTLDDLAVGRLLILVLRVLNDLLKSLQQCDQQRAKCKRACVAEHAHVQAGPQHTATHVFFVIMIVGRVVVLRHSEGHDKLVQCIHKGQDPEREHHVVQGHVILIGLKL